MNLSYSVDKNIGWSNTNRKQTKEKIGKLNPNQYHKDHFDYDYELDIFKYPEEEYLYFFPQYVEPHKNPEKTRQK